MSGNGENGTEESPESYDVVIIGGGPGGYTAALRAGQLGLRTACVEMRGALGGTCLNVGCIPSKALLHSSERFAEAKHALAEHGVMVGDLSLDLAAMMARKEKVVADLAKGIEFLFKKNDVDYVRGRGTVPAPGRVEVALSDGGQQILETRNVIVATGSEPAPLSGIEIDEKRILSSTGALALEAVPERLVVIGAGAIGLELGSVWSRLGSDVTVVEFLDRVLPGMDGEICTQTERVLKKQGLTFRLSSKVTEAVVDGARVRLRVAPAKREGAGEGAGEGANEGEGSSLEADAVLVSIGRRPYTEGLGLDPLGVERDERGFIVVDGCFQTTAPGIFAIGDCVPGPMLAHKAEEDGVACVEGIARRAGDDDGGHDDDDDGHDYGRVPGVVYTWPEVASVGRTQEQLDEAGVEYRVGKFPFAANSRARTTGDRDGLVKILADGRSDRILGVHILGAMAGDLIQEAVLAMEFAASAEDLARTCHAHPGMAEALKEAALAVDGRALNA